MDTALMDKRWCESCHQRRSPLGGEWVRNKYGKQQWWRCGTCTARRKAIVDDYEMIDRGVIDLYGEGR